VFEKKYLSIFSHVSYIKPAKEKDMKIIFDTFAKRYNIVPRNDLIDAIIEFSGGHVQYMHLALIILNEKVKDKNIDIEDLFNLFINDERVTTQSEEIWESLDANSKQVLHKICENEKIDEESKLKAKYLFDVGLCATSEKQINVFSPYFAHYIKQVYKNGNGKEKSIELSKKENSLFVLLLDNLNEVMERDKIISAVWPEYEELGVSDWTIDRLIARLRTKLSQQKNNYNIVTIKTRGFKMVES
ncbi:MAG TPA: helix-turn-helix domain-containing protein, partial [Candidatus Nitrosocosmicus sp.]|nr:helix-turn-helix domain-containing protein [Candidatus Nitrosocosmicus sp.]